MWAAFLPTPLDTASIMWVGWHCMLFISQEALISTLKFRNSLKIMLKKVLQVEFNVLDKSS